MRRYTWHLAGFFSVIVLLLALGVFSMGGANAQAPQNLPVSQVQKNNSTVPQTTSGSRTNIALQPHKAAAPNVVLYDQYDNASTAASVSQQFESDLSAYDAQLADDFAVPAGESWTIEEVDANGLYFNGPGPALWFNVYFYTNSGTFPATPVYTATNLTYSGNPDFVIPLTTPAVLSGGATYWVSVQARLDYAVGGEWGWTDRTAQSNNPAVWRNAGGGFGVCPDWTSKFTCIPTAGGPDQVFRLVGTSGTPVATSTATSTSLPASTSTATSSATSVPATATGTATSVPTGTATEPVGSPTATTTPCTINFSDVQESDYFYEDVRCVYCLGAVSGYSDGTFRPFNNTTRGQMAKIIVLALRIPIVTPTGTPTFNDVEPGSAFYDYVETAAASNIVSGYADGTFRPNNNVTRGQLSKIDVVAANQMLGWTVLNPATPTFTDVPPGSAFYTYIETAVCHGIISGYSDQTFRPGNNAIRAQIAKIVCRTAADPPDNCNQTGTPVLK